MKGRAWILAALAANVVPARAEAAAPAVVHRAVTCVPVDRYARVAASAPDAVRAELQFRIDAGSGWYAAQMARDGGDWVGFLPRPAAGTARVSYRVVATSADARTSATEPAEVRVVEEGAECADASSASVASPIVVTVPEGAPLVPPVPAGMSPAGVAAAAERPRSNKALKIAGAAAAVAVGAATAVGLSQSKDPETEPFRVPTLTFDRIDPGPGSTIFLAYEPIVYMVMDHQPAQVVTFVWQVEYIGAPGVCVRQRGVIRAQRPVELLLQSPLLPTGACGASFDVSALRIAMDHEGAVVFDQTLALPFRFVP